MDVIRGYTCGGSTVYTWSTIPKYGFYDVVYLTVAFKLGRGKLDILYPHEGLDLKKNGTYDKKIMIFIIWRQKESVDGII